MKLLPEVLRYILAYTPPTLAQRLVSKEFKCLAEQGQGIDYRQVLYSSLNRNCSDETIHFLSQQVKLTLADLRNVGLLRLGPSHVKILLQNEGIREIPQAYLPDVWLGSLDSPDNWQVLLDHLQNDITTVIPFGSYSTYGWQAIYRHPRYRQVLPDTFKRMLIHVHFYDRISFLLDSDLITPTVADLISMPWKGIAYMPTMKAILQHPSVQRELEDTRKFSELITHCLIGLHGKLCQIALIYAPSSVRYELSLEVIPNLSDNYQIIGELLEAIVAKREHNIRGEIWEACYAHFQDPLIREFLSFIRSVEVTNLR